MTVFLPPPVSLEPPPGEPWALADVVDDVAAAGFRLGEVAAHLAGPAAAAPGWLGADATAAVAQVGVVAALARDGSDALAAAAGRLAEHRFLLLQVRGRMGALLREQEDDFAAAEARLAGLVDHAAQVSMATDEPEAVAVVAELRAAEARRCREHARLLEELADDAASTARALADASAAVGGTGRRGDAGRAVAHLAAALPGWGDAELTARGHELARAFGGLSAEAGLLSPEDRNALAGTALPYAGSAPFAAALVRGMGVDGVREALSLLGDGALPAGGAFARVLADALGAARPTGAAYDPVGDVLDATFVDPDDYGTEPDLVALGMGTVLAAGSATRCGGPRPETVLSWGRQILAREQVQAAGAIGMRAVDRGNPLSQAMVPADPLAIVAETLARADDPSSAAAFLGDRETWTDLLARPWDDGGTSLAGLVRHAGTVSGPAGQEAVRSGLEALGTGLGDHGNPAHWTVDRATAATVAPALGGVLAGHVAVAVDVLRVGADGPSGSDDDALRGLGYLTIDRDAAATVRRALTAWAGAQPVALEGTDPAFPQPSVAVPSAYVAVREYGQRLDHALHGFEEQERAERRERNWDLLVGTAADLVAGPAGVAAGVAEGYLAIGLDFDGTWDNGPDRGLRFDADDAAAAVTDSLAPQARAAFGRAARALGRQAPPTSPEEDLVEPLLDGMVGLSFERLDNLPGRPR
jgi:hypothetical protein